MPTTFSPIINNPSSSGQFEILVNPAPEYQLILLNEQMQLCPLPEKVKDQWGNVIQVNTVYSIQANEYGEIEVDMTIEKGSYFLKIVPTTIYQTLQLKQSINLQELS